VINYSVKPLPVPSGHTHTHTHTHTHRLYDDAKDKVAACERKKESHDEKAKRQADIKRDVEKLEQENRIRQLKARVHTHTQSHKHMYVCVSVCVSVCVFV